MRRDNTRQIAWRPQRSSSGFLVLPRLRVAAAVMGLGLLGACGGSDPAATGTDAAAVMESDGAPAPGLIDGGVPADEGARDDGGDVTGPIGDAGSETTPDDTSPGLLPYPRPTYQHLADTGLFADPSGTTPAADLLRFRPAHVLWSDGAKKDRLVRLPPGTRIDTSDMDHWTFPIGTKVWKEFSRDGVKLETRLVERYGAGREDYWMGSFVWTADQTDAVFAVDGVANVNGTDHEAPPAKVCGACHRGEPGRLLGFSAIQLSHDDDGAANAPGATPDAGPAGDGHGKSWALPDSAAAGLLSNPPPAGTTYPVPGDPATATALGYLHANCGHCHNENGTSWPDTQMVMRLRVAERDPLQTEMVRSLVGQAVQYWRHPTIKTRVVAGDPDASAVLARMKIRGTRDQMPPLATRHVDPAAIDLLTGWITGLH